MIRAALGAAPVSGGAAALECGSLLPLFCRELARASPCAASKLA